MWWLIGGPVGLALCWLVLLGVRWCSRPEEMRLWVLLRLLPDVLRLARRLDADCTQPCGIRLRLWSLMAYLALPIDPSPISSPSSAHRRRDRAGPAHLGAEDTLLT